MRSPGTVRTAAAMRCPCRARSRTGSPRRVAERNPAAKASPAPTAATTSTRRAGTGVTVSALVAGAAVPKRSRRGAAVSVLAAGVAVPAAASAPRGPGRSSEAKTVAPALPRFTTSTDGSGSAARIASAPTIPHASSASSSPTKTRSARRASSSRTEASSARPRHRCGRWLTSNDTRGRPGRGAVSSRSRARQSGDSAAVIPDRCRTRLGEEGLVRNVLRGHRGRGRARPVVGDLVRVGPPVGGRAEVDAGRTGRVAADRRGVDPVRRDRLDEVVAEAVRADPADPGRPVVRRRARRPRWTRPRRSRARRRGRRRGGRAARAGTSPWTHRGRRRRWSSRRRPSLLRVRTRRAPR